MQWGHLELFCADTKVTRDFYVDGFGFEVEAEQPGGFIWLKSGSTEILLRPSSIERAAPERYTLGAFGLVLYTEDLPDTLATLARLEIWPDGDDGEGCPTFRDPDGHWVQVVENR